MDELQGSDPGAIGPFRLIGRLGQGGMGVVYLGASPGGREVAIKVVHPHYASDPEFRRRFAREVDAARRVGGFHTAAVVDADPGAGSPWMATAYIPGPSLADAVAQRGPLPDAAVRELGAELAEGVAAIHACGLIHRDLKPSNVILGDDGPRIIDFGIAKAADHSAVTEPHALLGTISYMSPELFRSEQLTPQSDVFALGGILTYAATGHVPFDGQIIPAVITRILSEPPDLTPLTGDLRDILAACLDKDPGQRPTPAGVLTLLNASLSGITRDARGSAWRHLSPPAPPTASTPVPVTAVEPASPPTDPGRTPTPRRRRTALIASGTAAVAGLAALTAVLLSSSPGAPQASANTAAAVPLMATLTAPTNQGVQLVAWELDGTIAVGGGNGVTYLWNTATRKVTGTLRDPGDPAGVGSIAWREDGTLATGDDNGHIYLWNTKKDTLASTLPSPGGGGTIGLAFGPADDLAATIDSGADIFNTASGQVTGTLDAPGATGGGTTALAFGPGSLLAVAEGNDTTYLWDSSVGRIVTSFVSPGRTSSGANSVDSLAWGPNGILAVGDSDGNTYLWSSTTEKLVATLVDPREPGQVPVVNCVAFAPDGTLATGDDKGIAYLWNIKTGKVTAKLAAPHAKGIVSVAFGPNGMLAAGDVNSKTYLWHT